MAEGANRKARKGRLPALFALAFATAFACMLSVPPAHAEGNGPGLLRALSNIFAPRREERIEPSPRVTAPSVRPVKRKPQAAPAVPEPVAVEKAPDARVILVVGDFLADGLAEGIGTVFADDPNVRVVNRMNGSSGLVRDDFYDWPARIGEIVDTEKPAVVVLMLGSNDRQQMTVGEGREQPLSDEWKKEYSARAARLVKAVAERKVPLIWVGLPSFKSSRMSSDILAINDLDRAAAAAANVEFVDVWEGFVDEEGNYVSTGPDINGQPVRLRAQDGINLTRSGKRKLAFYTEKALAKIVGEPGAAVAALPDLPDGSKLAPAGPAPDRTAPIPLGSTGLDGGEVLLGANPMQAAGPSGRAKAATEPVPGRADDFTWPPQDATPAAPQATGR